MTMSRWEDSSTEQLNEWFAVLHRVAQLQFDDPMNTVTAPRPLSQAMQDCIDRGWLMAWDSGEVGDAGKSRILIRPEGRNVYRQWCDMLAASGRPVDPNWVREFG